MKEVLFSSLLLLLSGFSNTVYASCPPWERYLVATCGPAGCTEAYRIEDGGPATQVGCAGLPGEFRATPTRDRFKELSKQIFTDSAKEGVYLLSDNAEESESASLGVLWLGHCYSPLGKVVGKQKHDCAAAILDMHIQLLTEDTSKLDAMKDRYLKRSQKNWDERQARLREGLFKEKDNGS